MYIGHDAELEVVDEKGEAVPAHKFFKPKSEPEETGYVAAVSPYHRDQIFRDGTSLELNTPGCIQCFAALSKSTYISMAVAKRKLPIGYNLQPTSAYEVKAGLEDAPPDVMESGCHPVRNAYEGWEEKPLQVDPGSKLRFAGGHIHLGAEIGMPLDRLLTDEKQRADACQFIVKYLDLYCAVPMVYTGIEGEAGKARRLTYGKAGEYRYQEYKAPAGVKLRGIEYRVLGPEWLKDIGLMALAFNLARGVARKATDRFVERRKEGAKKVRWSSLLLEAREAINKGDVKEIFESPAYQKKLEKTLKVVHWSQDRFKISHIKFIRENRERLFPAVGVNPFPENTNHNWPECLPRWGFQ